MRKYEEKKNEERIQKMETFTPILDKLGAKVHGWKATKLSAGGKEVLINSVLNSVPQYWFSTFLLPDKILAKIQTIINNFWWSNSGTKRGVHWVRQEILKQSKEEGGLGFRDWKSLNFTFLAKQAWRLHSRPQLLVSKLVKAKYFPDSHILDATQGYRPSHVWRSIFKSLTIIRQGTSRCPLSGTPNWTAGSSSTFSVKSAYVVAKHMQDHAQSDNFHLKVFWRTIWKLPLPRKIKVFAWKGYQGALHTGKAK
ncbi:hypothetical protein QQ045_029706 [Rhodiola kirilowii]